MKKSHFKIGLLTACLVSVSSVSSAQTCGAESCDSGACKCSKKHCNDTGLLEVINSTASNFEAKLASMIPDRDAPCVKTKSKCTCSKCSGGGATPRNSIPKPAPHFAPPVAQPDAVHPPMPRMTPPPNPIVDPVPAPVPNAVTPERIPLPESRDNPFKDDPTTRNLRPMPGRPASYLRSSENRVIEYDPQASNQPVLHSVLVSKAASKKISDSSNGLAKSSSTRRVLTSSDVSEPKEPSVFEQVPPAVVPASLNAPITRLRPLSTMPPAADQFINPLRAN